MTSEYLATPQPPPELDFPASSSTVKVSVIDPGAILDLPAGLFLTPEVGGKTRLTAPAFSFLIEHSSGQKILFDLSLRKDFENLAPAIMKQLEGGGWDFKRGKNVIEVLEEGGVKGSEIDAIIWSHHHLDHTGDPSTFPSTTALVVGPGFKETMLPGYPANPDSPLLESDWAGRELREISFEKGKPGVTKIGRFNALDYFGDGSFYLLDTPGHTIGHLCGLARVTTKASEADKDTFVYMGGDVCHHGGEFRPTPYLPLPKELSPAQVRCLKFPCPGSVFQDLHPKKSATEPFFNVSAGLPYDIEQANWSIDGTTEFDCHENVFVVIAHDESLLPVLKFWPEGDINGWKEQGMWAKGKWAFLKDFEKAIEH